jgi:hypothetical protein
VFLTPEGAIKNLAYLAIEMQKTGMEGNLSIEVFESSGNRRLVNDADGASRLLAELKAQRD